MASDGDVVIQVIGEGRADLGMAPRPTPPDRGVVPILMHKLCGKPARLRVDRRPFSFLQGHGLQRKIRYAKRQALISGLNGLVVVLDSEGGAKELKGKQRDLSEARDHAFPDFPMAVGVAQPCIESWLLADAAAIQRSLKLGDVPELPERPEELPAPCCDRRNNPKTELARAAGHRHGEIPAKDKDKIAAALNDMGLLRQRCPLGFAPFAEEVETHIRPLF